ncbi:MAG TPA: hypothetical protein VIK56_08665 [Rhodoferax sp.]
MFIPFLAAAAIATALIKLGALSAWVTVLSLALKTVTIIALATALYATALTLKQRHNR